VQLPPVQVVLQLTASFSHSCLQSPPSQVNSQLAPLSHSWLQPPFGHSTVHSTPPPSHSWLQPVSAQLIVQGVLSEEHLQTAESQSESQKTLQ